MSLLIVLGVSDDISEVKNDLRPFRNHQKAVVFIAWETFKQTQDDPAMQGVEYAPDSTWISPDQYSRDWIFWAFIQRGKGRKLVRCKAQTNHIM